MFNLSPPRGSSKRSANEDDKDSDEWSMISGETAGSTTEAFAKKLKLEEKEEDDSYSVISSIFSQKSTTEALAKKLTISDVDMEEIGDFKIITRSDTDADWAFWKKQFQNTFGYRLPLRHLGFGRFQFVKEEEFGALRVNPWKLAYEELSNGVHVTKKVRPGMNDNMLYFEQLDDAMAFLNQNPEGIEKLIFIHAGTHTLPDTLEIPSDVQIIGAADSDDIPESVVITGHHKTLLDFQEGPNSAYLGYLTVKFDPFDVSESEVYALKMQGEHVKPTIEYCNVTSKYNEGAAILVKELADPKIINCTISKTNTCGIVVSDEGKGTFENCEITDNERGVSIRKHAEPQFINCHISNHHGVGVRISDHAQGVFDDCKIYANNGAGMKLKHHANPEVRNCSFFKGNLCGIHVHQSATGNFTNNKIYQNTKSGVWITGQANPIFRENFIFQGLSNGICVHTGGQGLIEGNDIYENNAANVVIREQASNPVIRGNRIRNGCAEGVHVHSHGRGTIANNEIYANNLAGVFVTTDGKPDISNNKIFDGKQAGLSFVWFGSGFVTENDIYSNRKNGIEIQIGGNPYISENRIRANRKGVVMYNSARGRVVRNEITDSIHAGVDLRGDTEVNVEKGTEHIYDPRSVVMENQILRNGIGIRTDEEMGGMNCEVRGNNVSENFGPATNTDNIGFEVELLRHNTIGDNQNARNANGEQKFPIYSCTQCSETTAICEKCALRCHKGHKILFMKDDKDAKCGCQNEAGTCCEKL